jgi:hypothetical protein
MPLSLPVLSPPNSSGLNRLLFSQRRSGGAGPPFRATAGGRCDLHNAGYLRLHIQDVGTRPVASPPARAVGSLLPRAACSTRYEHAELSAFYIDSGPVWIFCRLGPWGCAADGHGFSWLALSVLLQYDTVRYRTRMDVLKIPSSVQAQCSVPQVWQPAAGDLLASVHHHHFVTATVPARRGKMPQRCTYNFSVVLPRWRSLRHKCQRSSHKAETGWGRAVSQITEEADFDFHTDLLRTGHRDGCSKVDSLLMIGCR